MLTTLAEIVFQLALGWLFQSSLFLLPACVVLSALRRRGPHFEALACRLLLVGVLITPLTTASLRAFGMRGWPVITHAASSTVAFNESMRSPVVSIAKADTMRPSATTIENPPNVPTIQLPAANAARNTASRQLWPAVCLLVSVSSITVSGILFVRLLRATRVIHQITRAAQRDSELQAHCQRLADSIKVHCPSVLRTDRVNGPCLVGAIRPAILIPIAHTDSPRGWSQVLVHELAHVQRQDVLWNWLFRLTVALIPFQPLLWWLHRRHETAAEQASDDLVVEHVDEPTSYAKMLLQLASSRHAQSPVAVGMIARPPILSQRIRRILDEQCQHGLTASRTVKSLALLMVSLQCGAVSWLWLPASDSQAATAQEAGAAASPNEWVISGEVIGIDGRPAVKATVLCTTNNYWNFQQTLTTDAQGKFTLRLGDQQAGISDVDILARSADGQALIYDSVLRPTKDEPSKPLVLKLERARSIEVHVLDETDQPVADAKASVQILGSFQTSTTNGQGIARFSVPEHQHIARAAAWKDQVGFDYVAYEPSANSAVEQVLPAPEFPASGVQPVKLTGAKRVTLFVTDTDGQPIPHVSIHVGQFQKSNEQSFSTSTLEALTQERFAKPTDANGRTEFNCIPTWHNGELSFWSETREYERKQVNHPIWSDEPVRMQLDRMVAIRGRVTQPNGQPAKGVKVHSIGDTYNISHNEATAFTDGDGRYTLSVPPRHVYMVGVQADTLAAATQTIVLNSGQSVANIDFQLTPAHRITGRVIDRDDREPLIESWVFAREYGPKDRSANTALPAEYADTPWWTGPYFHYSAQTDASGRYEFLLGDGDFEIYSESPRGLQSIEFRSQADLTLKDIEVNAGDEFSGLVVQASDGRPVEKAQVEAWTLGLESWEAQTDAAGKFKVRRPDGQTAVRVLSPDRKYGAIEIVSSENKVAFSLQRLGQVTGRLVSANGQPLPKRTIGCFIRMTAKHVNINPAFAPYTSCFGSAVYTDDKGQFQLSQLVPDQDYYLTYYADADGTNNSELTKIKVTPDQSLDLGDVKVR